VYTLTVGIEMILPELDFPGRIDRLSALGISAFEIAGWRDKDIGALEESMKRNGCSLAVLNLDPPVNVLEGGAKRTWCAP
jgi:hypothetical protein